MATCTTCGRSAGLLRKQHKDCAQVRDAVAIAVRERLLEIDTRSFVEEVQRLAVGKVDDATLGVIVAGTFGSAMDAALADGLMSQAEEDRLMGAIEALGVTAEALTMTDRLRFAHARVLRELTEHGSQTSVEVENPGFNLMKSETLIWVTPAIYYETQTHKTHVGGSRGVSVRLAKGVHYRVGEFKGRTISTEIMMPVADGDLAFTTKHLYFQGSDDDTNKATAFRVRYDKLVTFTPYENGFGFVRDTKGAREEVFKGLDGWFLLNMVQLMASRAD